MAHLPVQDGVQVPASRQHPIDNHVEHRGSQGNCLRIIGVIEKLGSVGCEDHRFDLFECDGADLLASLRTRGSWPGQRPAVGVQ